MIPRYRCTNSPDCGDVLWWGPPDTCWVCDQPGTVAATWPTLHTHAVLSELGYGGELESVDTLLIEEPGNE